MKVLHAVVTSAFAGAERYVADVSNEQARQGHEVTVIGGTLLGERLDPAVRYLVGSSVAFAIGAAARSGRMDIAHAHLTYGEFALAVTQGRHGGALVATRHLATPRGQHVLGRLARPLIERRLAAELATSEFVAQQLHSPHLHVLHNGVADAPLAGTQHLHILLMAQRLEAEKATDVGLRAWDQSGLADKGWQLWIAGEGSQSDDLKRLARSFADGDAVRFLGRVDDMSALYAQVAALLAPCAVDALGLSVLEAMARGIPVTAAAAGGHLETIGPVPGCLFPPGDAAAAGELLKTLEDVETRLLRGGQLRTRQQSHFRISQHVSRLSEIYLEANRHPASS